MINLALLVIFAIVLALVLKRDIEDVMPAFVASLLICFYGIAILGKAHHIFEFSILVFGCIYVIYIARNKRLLPKVAELREDVFNSKHAGFFLYLVVVAAMCYLYSTHFVHVWDDFHYNATFPKNMFYYGTMPWGYNSTTGYKDYFPTQQLFFYWGFQGIKGFSEPLMFQYKMFLIYTFLLPLFKQVSCGRTTKRFFAGIVAIIMPFMILFEVLESLSMDTVIALLFANALISIFKEEGSWFRYYYIGVMLTALVIYKSYALIFACIALAVWFVNDIGKGKKNYIVIFVGTCIVVFGAYISWRVYCNTHGNSTYLSNILVENIKSGEGIVLPEYGVATIKAMMDSIVTLRLNFGKFSFTVLSSMIVYIIVAIMMVISKEYSVRDFLSDVIIIGGFIGFYIFLIYTYLFIFEEWEALSLSSLDRYLGTYVLLIVFICAYRVFFIIDDNSIMIAFTLVCAISLNFGLLEDEIIPDNYVKYKADTLAERNEVKEELKDIVPGFLDKGAVLLVSDEVDTLYMRSMQYELIPEHVYQYNINDYVVGNRAEGLVERIYDRDTYYVYMTNHMSNNNDFGELSSLMEAGITLESGHWYYYDREAGVLKNAF